MTDDVLETFKGTPDVVQAAYDAWVKSRPHVPRGRARVTFAGDTCTLTVYRPDPSPQLS